MRTTVFLIVYRLYDYEGNNLTFGGQQRYLLTLVELLEAQGFRCHVFQKAFKGFVREIGCHSVVEGIQAPVRNYGNPIFNLRVHQRIPKSAPVLYVSSELAFPIIRDRSVAIQHGIWWDSEYGWWQLAITRMQTRWAVRRLAGMVCVDTNFINWYRATWPWQSEDHKLIYVPNFTDVKKFGTESAVLRSGDKPIILFPRRAEIRRGAYLFLNVAKDIATKYPDAEYVFAVGSGREINGVRDRVEEFGLQNRTRVVVAGFDEMPALYHSASIVVIPTIAGEGTSLSCIEAMAAGCAVISTTVGGLPNLIQDQYSGLLIRPTESDLRTALQQLLDNPGLRQRLGFAAKGVAETCFSLELWSARVWELLNNVLMLRPAEQPIRDC